MIFQKTAEPVPELTREEQIASLRERLHDIDAERRNFHALIAKEGAIPRSAYARVQQLNEEWASVLRELAELKGAAPGLAAVPGNFHQRGAVAAGTR